MNFERQIGNLWKRFYKCKDQIFKVLILFQLLLIIACNEELEKKIELPIVIVSEISNITSNSAESGGEVTSDGSGEVIARGVCWSTSNNPSIDNNKTIDGAGIGSFSSTINGLEPNTTYNFNAYAINSVGTGYSSQFAFTTLGSFKIIDINDSSSKIVVGQRNIFRAFLSDSTGNINYEWKLFYNFQQVGILSGIDLKSLRINTTKVGEYTLILTITRGASDRSTFEKKFNSIAGNFQYGIWGDNEETIKNAETDNGFTIYNALVGKPIITPKIENLTTLTYKKDYGDFYTYYFSSGKLYAGAYTATWNYLNINTDLRSAYSSYYTEKRNLEKILGITLPDSKIWRITDQSQITYWDSDALTRSQAIGLNYLELKTEGESSLGKGSLRLYKPLSQYVGFEYILVSPN